MKWLLLIVVIGLAFFGFRQSQQIAELNQQLQAANAQIAELQKPPKTPVGNYDPFAGTRPGGPRGTMLDAPTGNQNGRH
jgi:hypothetical protein